jgi:hypothetical protein
MLVKLTTGERKGVEILFLWSISLTYYVQLLRRYFCAKKVQTLNLSTKKLREKLSYEKGADVGEIDTWTVDCRIETKLFL